MTTTQQKTLSGFRAFLFRHWANPVTRGTDVNAAATISLHQRIISENPILRYLYRSHYERFLPAVRATAGLTLPMVEVGAGPSHIDRYIPGVLKSDVVSHSNIDLVAAGETLPFGSNSLRCLFLLNSFHHLKDPERFLHEVDRCLASTGRLTLVEPNPSWPAKFISSFSPYEYFDDAVLAWSNRGTERLSEANNSLPWVVFVRDRKEFDRRFPRLKIVSIRYHTFLAFYFSGGFNYRPFVSARWLPVIRLIEWLSKPLCRRLGCQMTIEIEKR